MPDDEAEIRAIEHDLYLPYAIDLEPLQPARLAWERDQGIAALPPPIEAPFALSTGQICYMTAIGSWAQQKAESLPLEADEGIFDRPDDFRVISDGTLAITNECLVFRGDRRSTELKYSLVASVEAFGDALRVRKRKGSTDYFSMTRIESERAKAIILLLLGG